MPIRYTGNLTCVGSIVVLAVRGGVDVVEDATVVETTSYYGVFANAIDSFIYSDTCLVVVRWAPGGPTKHHDIACGGR